jgi:large subunit ribosomal protein L15
MKLSELPKIKGNEKEIIRRGRGWGKHGRYCGFGQNGQKSRSGRTKGPAFEGGSLPTFRKIPVLRGFRSLHPHKFAIINLDDLERFPQNTEVTISLLVEEGIIRNALLPVKVLGAGEIKRPLTIKVHAASGTAREKIAAAGAKLEIIGEAE